MDAGTWGTWAGVLVAAVGIAVSVLVQRPLRRSAPREGVEPWRIVDLGRHRYAAVNETGAAVREVRIEADRNDLIVRSRVAALVERDGRTEFTCVRPWGVQAQLHITWLDAKGRANRFQIVLTGGPL